MYDSTPDTMKHIANLQIIMNGFIIPELEKRSDYHDMSKLKSPEKETYDEYIPKLREYKYGTEEYMKLRDEMTEKGLKHHYEMNRHHPEHFQDGICGMNLIDLVEMFSDWVAASLRSDTSFEDGLQHNFERYHMSEDLQDLFKNTYRDIIKKDEDNLKKIQ